MFRFLDIKTKTVTFTAIILGVSAFLSKILALFRDNLLANLFSKAQTDIYFAAFRVPDLIYGILITGGIVATFIPIFASCYKKSEEEARQLVNSVFTFFLLALVVISGLLFIFTPQLIDIITPGFKAASKAKTVLLTRIMFLSPIVLGSSAILSGIIQYFNLFFVYALAPLLYNIGIIIGILVFAPLFGLKGLAFGIILGALLHLFVQVPSLRKKDFIPKFSFNFQLSGLKKILRLMGPRVLGAATYRINLIVVTSIASTLTAGAISVFNFANNLQHVPIGLIGTSFAIASFPLLSRQVVEKRSKEFLQNFLKTFSQILYLVIPISGIIFLLRAQIVRLILGTSLLEGIGFGWFQTRLTAACLGVFAFSLFAATLVPFLSRVFFSFHNTRVPAKIAVAAMGINIGLCFLLVEVLQSSSAFRGALVNFLNLKGLPGISVIGLPLALSIAIIFQLICLVVMLKKCIGGLSYAMILHPLKEIIPSSLVMGLLVYGTLHIYAIFGSTVTVLGLLTQTLIALVVGALSYLSTSLAIGSSHPREIYSSITSQFRK